MMPQRLPGDRTDLAGVVVRTAKARGIATEYEQGMVRDRFGCPHRLRREADMGMMDHRFDIVDKAVFRSGMSRLGSAVNVVTAMSGGKRYGFTASAVCSVSDAPATLLVCINRASSCFHAFENTNHFCVNTLMPGQEDISNVFGGKLPREDRFAIGEWREGLTGVPVLANASVSFECQLTNAVDEATHRILFGRVIDICEHEEQATLLYCMRRYLNG